MVEDRRRRHCLGRDCLRPCSRPAVFQFGQPPPLGTALSAEVAIICTVASIIAVHASNGEIAWHFQTTPGDNWDYDATQPHAGRLDHRRPERAK
jgi:hypothetical protein